MTTGQRKREERPDLVKLGMYVSGHEALLRACEWAERAEVPQLVADSRTCAAISLAYATIAQTVMTTDALERDR